ncbi:MAG: hypothetical protein O9293_11155 [Porphyrobacter sp.]|nr:hypothetical protein [Porphyrobacter sp.]
MSPIIYDDEDTADRSEPDAHGQAALLLAESILHVLVETQTLSLDEAISVIETTCAVKIEVAERAGESSKRMNESLYLLRRISNSFKSDLS